MPAESADKIDAAVNILAKPFSTSLAILSLLKQSGDNLARLWLQFEPVGLKYDPFPAYCIHEYVTEKGLCDCVATQPEQWQAREPLKDLSGRARARYQDAFERTEAPYLFLMHNDVFIFKDILGALRAGIGEAFAIGQIGQCWNCPAANAGLMRDVLGRPPCSPAAYQNVRLDRKELAELYASAAQKGIFARPYELGAGEFADAPWPLPECRVNEWACLINMAIARPATAPHGAAWPPGAYRDCGGINLDIGCAWFRDMHAQGHFARHFDVKPFMLHWVGTGKNTPARYARLEDNSLRLLRRHFPDYANWLDKKYGLPK